MRENQAVWRPALVLALAGGLAFWLANFAISRTPVAAEYRAALSISYYPMLLESLVGGLLIGFAVGYLLLCFFDRIPGSDPMGKAITLSGAVLVLVTFLITAPSSSFSSRADVRYFLIGTAFNLIRLLALGIVIGYVGKRRYA